MSDVDGANLVQKSMPIIFPTCASGRACRAAAAQKRTKGGNDNGIIQHRGWRLVLKTVMVSFCEFPMTRNLKSMPPQQDKGVFSRPEFRASPSRDATDGRLSDRASE